MINKNSVVKATRRPTSMTQPDQFYDMVNDLIAEEGYPSMSAVVHQAVVRMHRAKFGEPRYQKQKPTRQSPESTQIDEAVPKNEIVSQLKGEVVEKNGDLYCRYYTYTYKNRFEQYVLLDLLTADLIATQYEPSRAEVERMQASGQVNYEVGTTPTPPEAPAESEPVEVEEGQVEVEEEPVGEPTAEPVDEPQTIEEPAPVAEEPEPSDEIVDVDAIRQQINS